MFDQVTIRREQDFSARSLGFGHNAAIVEIVVSMVQL
jgi:hypothetical protein